MTLFEAALLGFVQALTEFLPVSSSGHLQLFRDLLGVQVEGGLLFDLVLHFGTLVAVFIVYRERIAELLRSIGGGLRQLGGGLRAALEASEALRYALLLGVALVPTGVLGLLISGLIKSDLYTVRVVGILLIINGFLLLSIRWAPSSEGRGSTSWLSVHGIGVREAFLIGLVQGLAVVPGISRSGSTIVAAIFVGAARPRAAEFSFFLSIPTILGALTLEFLRGYSGESVAPWGHYAVGAAISLIFGVIALRMLLKFLAEAKLWIFAPWCWVAGLVALFWPL